MTYFPQPMNDMLQNAIKPEISSEADIADFNIMTLTALKSASVATSTDLYSLTFVKQWLITFRNETWLLPHSLLTEKMLIL